MDIPTLFEPGKKRSSEGNFKCFLEDFSKELASTLHWSHDTHLYHDGRKVVDYYHFSSDIHKLNGNIILWKPMTEFGIRVTFSVVTGMKLATNSKLYGLKMIDDFTIQAVKWDSRERATLKRGVVLATGVSTFRVIHQAHLSNSLTVAKTAESIVSKYEQYEERDTFTYQSVEPCLPEYDFVLLNEF